MELISYYDTNLFAVYQSLNDVEKSFVADWVPVIKEEFIDFKWGNFSQPVDSKTYFEKPSSIVLFKVYQNNRRGTDENIENALEKISDIRTLIKTQLK